MYKLHLFFIFNKNYVIKGLIGLIDLKYYKIHTQI